MDTNLIRSEQVVEAFKRHKLASSIFSRINHIIEGFNEDTRIDRLIAEIGLVVLLIATSLLICVIRIF